MLAVRSVLVLLATLAVSARGANILGLFSSHSPSHLIVHMSVAKALAEAGHNVTVVAMQQPKVMHKNIHLIVVPVKEEQERVLEDQLATMAGQKNSMLSTLNRMMNGMNVIIDAQADLLSDPRFQRIYETKFDLMIMGYFINDFQLGVAAKLNVPVIISWMNAPIPIIDDFTGNPIEVAYVPNMATFATHPMGLVKRAENLVKYLFLRYMATVLDIRVTRHFRDNFGEEKGLRSLSEMRRNISLAFVNCHLISEGPIRPLVPAIVEIGGIQVKDTPDPLPSDIKQFLEKSKDGAILLSLGSNVKSTAVKPEVVQVIYKALSGIKRNVIWKWEDLENIPGNASNILYKKWLPQDDILAHPNTKLFITHAGKGGITEAQYHGVPMVALPIFGDQLGNADQMQNSGYGLALDLQSITEESLTAALKEVLENDKYRKTISSFTSLYRDRPMTARQTVVYWTEYVLRHRGAPHLQSPSVHMSFVELHNLDLYALLIPVLAIVVFLAQLTLRFAWKKLMGKSKSNPKTANKQKKH
ncbi:UDP-glucuronosyltransferase 1-5 [Drosophila guanche]|uniref:Blast:UDP-glucuronosyltransferase 1-5 n=1 Tax=Drosophila guanche TaxID=7266 RepID=A0A3B0K8A5_DROGU|nr:UDP-glucuronosyltransferase 1-5 [Drosophila guanche]SPP82269.1 blast:UDP-glucuronosyltransferase 1-5 [Drosophila guanche]